jgi:excisionase family DNA binding protein
VEIPSYTISASVKEFARISGLGESTVWAMIHDGRLESIAIGRRRLVLIESYRRLIEQQRAAPPRDARRNSAVPPLGSTRRGAVPAPVNNSEAKTRRGRRPGRGTATIPRNYPDSADDPAEAGEA